MQGRLEHELKINNYINGVLVDLPNFVNEWHMNLMASSKTAATRRDFVNKIARFLKSINENTKEIKCEDITEDKIISYFISCKTKEDKNGNVVYTSDSYQQCVWCTLNNFLEYLYKKKYITENYMENISKPKNNDLQRINENRIVLTKKDFKKILSVIENSNSEMMERDLAIMALFMNTGMRESALTEINVKDFDLAKSMLNVVDKGNKKHTYVINEDMECILMDWIYERKCLLNGKENDALFLNEDGERISQNGIVYIVKKYTKEALGKALSPHKLRGGFVSILYKETGDAEFCRRAVGHSNIATTQRYIATGGEEKERASKLMQNMLF